MKDLSDCLIDIGNAALLGTCAARTEYQKDFAF